MQSQMILNNKKQRRRIANATLFFVVVVVVVFIIINIEAITMVAVDALCHFLLRHYQLYMYMAIHSLPSEHEIQLNWKFTFIFMMVRLLAEKVANGFSR